MTVPKWASFLDNNEYTLFIKELDRYFKGLKLGYEIGDGEAIVAENNRGFNKLGLMNVAQVCKQAEQQSYRGIIEDHFQALIDAKEFDAEFEKIIDDFEKVRQYIAVRIYNDEYVSFSGIDNVIGRQLAEDVYAMLVFDLPYSIESIRPEKTTQWGKTADELFDIGVQNVRENYPLSITKETFQDFDIWFVQGEHFFTSNIVFDIEKYEGLVGSKGALVGLPHRHSAIIYPVENIETVKAINGLIPAINGMNQEGPGSLSANLFWYNESVLTMLPYTVKEGKLQFFPPEEFLKMLNEL